jgi:hypothetical protein
MSDILQYHGQSPLLDMTGHVNRVSQFFVFITRRNTEPDDGCASEFSAPSRDQAPDKENLKWFPLAGNEHTELGVAWVLVELTAVPIASLSVAASIFVLVERKCAGLRDWKQLNNKYCPSFWTNVTYITYII